MSGQGHVASALRQLLGASWSRSGPRHGSQLGWVGFLGVKGGFRGEAGERNKGGLAGDGVGGREGSEGRARPTVGSGGCPDLSKQVLFWEGAEM